MLVERIAAPASDGDLRDLARLLADAVAEGAAVSFVAPLTATEAEAWWREALGRSPAPMVLVSRRDDGRIVGTVQVQPAWAPNQPRRAELVKLLVAREARGSGVGARLVEAAEVMARDAGFTLLTLDAKRGEAAERLYRRLGWTHVGTIPDFALDPDGETLHDAVLFYKRLAAPRRRPTESSGEAVRLGPEDWRAYREVMLEGYGAHPEAFTSTREERERVPPDFWRARLDGDGSVAFGVWLGDDLAGVVAVVWATRPKERHRATLVGLYVRARYRGRGVASALVAAVLAEAESRPSIRVVDLTVSEPNQAARRLYERHGFVVFGLEPEAMAHEGGYLGKFHMWCRVGA